MADLPLPEVPGSRYRLAIKNVSFFIGGAFNHTEPDKTTGRLKMKRLYLLTGFFLCCFANVCSGNPQLQTFPLSDVKLLDGPFKHAEQNDLKYVMSLDPDRLLTPYRLESGIRTESKSYGNWESTGLGGHIGGHYLSALAMLYASTGDRKVYERLEYMVSELKKCQDKNGDGYLGGVPDGKILWKEIRNGHIDADNFTLNGKWVPWYNLHKLYAGLRDAYLYAGNLQARDMLIQLADWSMNLTSSLSDEQMQEMLRTEHGGMNEVLADVAAITGDRKYIKFARKFSHQEILNPLLGRQDQLTGLHANTQIPKVIGFKRIADISGDDSWNDAAEFFWESVVNDRSVAIGGNSVREHFHPVDDFQSMISEVEGPETCNTYNMLRLSNMLFRSSGSSKFIDYYERALYNHILSSQHPDHGGLVYFTPMRPLHYRVYSQPQEAMWCCVGSGIENHARYGELIYAYTKNELYVNLYIPSTLHWKEKNISIIQETTFPDADNTQITIKSAGRFTLKLRYPAWVKKGSLRLTLNNKRLKVKSLPGEYISIDRTWQAGDSISLKMPMHIAVEQLPDKSDYYAVLYGPIVLAAKTDPVAGEQLDFLSDDSRMGHVPQGSMCPTDAAPVLVAGSARDFVRKIKPVPGKSLTFTAPDLIDSPNRKAPELIPFFRIHDARYVVYWPSTTRDGLEEFRNTSAKIEQARLALEAITIDQVAPGEQQPESDHFFQGERSESGVNMRRHWRHAYGWFSYRLKDENKETKYLQITYFGADRDRHFDIFINDIKIATVDLLGDHGAEFYTVEYPVPAEVLNNAENNTLITRFVAHKDSIAGGIYHVRLLKDKKPAGTK